MARGNALGANKIDLPIDTSSPETMLASLKGTARRLAVECERNGHVTFSLSPQNALLLARALENQRNEARHDIELQRKCSISRSGGPGWSSAGASSPGSVDSICLVSRTVWSGDSSWARRPWWRDISTRLAKQL